ncbi:MAG: hypothetical protein V1823_05365 [Chloroflexota bacterium]
MSAKQSYQWPKKLHVIAWKNMGEDIVRSWGEVLTADTGMKVHVAGEYDTVDRFRWLGRLKLFDLTAGAPSETSQALMADRRYCVRDGGPFKDRIVWVATKGNAGFFTRGDSRIKKPQDIKPGTRINKMTYVAATRVMDGLLAWAGVSPKDIVWVDVGDSDENWQAVVEGRSDLGFSFPTAPTIAEAEKNPKGLGWIDLNSKTDPAGARRFGEWDPLVNFGPIHSGVKSALGHWGTVGINFEQTRADTDPQLVYNLAKWFDENYERFKDRHEVNQWRNRETLIEGLKHTFLPCHEGLIPYLKEIGVWTKAHDKRQKENQELVDGYADGYLKCMWQADEKKIWVARENEEWVKFWNDYKKANLREFKLFEDLPKVTA